MNATGCSGERGCTADIHVHGCFADLGGTQCDHPEAHGDLGAPVRRSTQVRFVYVASSWRNPLQPVVVKALRASSIDCYDFRDPSGDGTGGFSWRDVRGDTGPVDPVCTCGHPLSAHGRAITPTPVCWHDSGPGGLAAPVLCDCRVFTKAVAPKGTDLEPVDVYLRMLDHPAAADGFARDFAAMERADTFVLVLPCGRSAHLELGWAVGAGKRTAILLKDPAEPELMYRMVDYMTPSLDDLVAWLTDDTHPEVADR